MERLGPLWQLSQAPFLECLGERIEQQPDVAPFEFFMLGFTPLMEYRRDETVAAHAHIRLAIAGWVSEK